MTGTITPFLWFDGKAEEAANFYVSVFKNARIHKIHRYGDAGPGARGSVMTVEFELDGMRLVGLNGGPQYQFTPAISFAVNCETQAEVDELWEKLTAGGKEVQCGWLVDRFGVSWQIVPSGLVDLLAGKDPEKSQAAMQAMFAMKKLDIAALRQAYDRA
jgi:predicted 3-demethylubiquinone-9 3-methyltransferase (glyoxalase superfamily)